MKPFHRRTMIILGGAALAALLLGAAAGRIPRTVIVDGVSGIVNTVAKNTILSLSSENATATDETFANPPAQFPPLDKSAYSAKILALAHIPPAPRTASNTSSTSPATSTGSSSQSTDPFPPYSAAPGRAQIASLWPAAAAPEPENAGAFLPFHRIVAYYGNLYSKQMGVLGEYPSDQMLQMLTDQAAKWAAADPSTPVVPALDYIAVSAQASPGSDGKYRLRMPDDQIDKIIQMAGQINGIVILDIQVGLSDVETEIPVFEKYLKMPQVELALDPEFDMHNGQRPGTVIGTMDASDVNWAIRYLANLVTQNNLPPKILIVHRFTQDMLTNSRTIAPLPQVQFVMDMDGFGYPAKKIGTYYNSIEPYPVQFTGFKLFYKNDALASSSHVMTPQEVLRLSPQPSFIQYQ